MPAAAAAGPAPDLHTPPAGHRARPCRRGRPGRCPSRRRARPAPAWGLARPAAALLGHPSAWPSSSAGAAPPAGEAGGEMGGRGGRGEERHRGACSILTSPARLLGRGQNTPHWHSLLAMPAVHPPHETTQSPAPGLHSIPHCCLTAQPTWQPPKAATNSLPRHPRTEPPPPHPHPDPHHSRARAAPPAAQSRPACTHTHTAGLGRVGQVGQAVFSTKKGMRAG